MVVPAMTTSQDLARILGSGSELRVREGSRGLALRFGSSTTTALGSAVFWLQLANLAGELVYALPHGGESKRRRFQSVGRSASGHSRWRHPGKTW
jgi:hypothetical protein